MRATLDAATALDWKSRGLTLSSSLENRLGLSSTPAGLQEGKTASGELPTPDDRRHLGVKEYLDSAPIEWRSKWVGRDIQQHHWKPALGTAGDIDEDLRLFVLSCMPRFDKLAFYGAFWLYCEQARRWEEETRDIEVTDLTIDEAILFTDKELRRMRDNSLYAMIRYVYIREDSSAKGRKYGNSYGCPQAYLCWAIDRGNSIALLKGRQAAITSTVLAVISLIMLLRNNVTAVLLTDDKTKTGEDLFDKKAIATLKLLPDWITQQIRWERLTKDLIAIDFGGGTSKGERKANYSDFMLLSCDDTQAVNSKTPTITIYDEAQNIPTFGQIVGEVSSTQFSLVDGELKRTRQQIAFGTGSSNATGKGVFLDYWNVMRKNFEDGINTDGWLPMFFDCTCKPGYSLKWYMSLRAAAEAKGKNGDRQAMAIFASACPLHWDDAFMDGHNKIIPTIIIKRNRDTLMAVPDSMRPIRGRFEAEYDMDKPTKKDGNADHPAYIRSVRFVPSKTSYDMLHDPVQMWLPPKNNWIDCNFQGTDPIQSVSGHSKFASAIYDAVGHYHPGGTLCCGRMEPHFHPTIACLLNGRLDSVKEIFSQSAMMGMFYHNHGQRACKELVEWNQGQLYVDYKQSDWIDCQASLLAKTQLKEIYQTKSANPYGFHMTVDTKGRLLRDIEEFSEMHGHNIRFIEYWSQIQEIEMEEKDGRKTWGTRDEEKFNDDVVIAVTMAKVCHDSVDREPRMFDSPEAPSFRTRVVPRHVKTPMGWRLMQVEESVQAKYRQ